MTEKVFPLIVRRAQLKELVGISPSTAARLEADPTSGFPSRKAWSAKVCGWDGAELEKWVKDCGREITGMNPIARKSKRPRQES